MYSFTREEFLHVLAQDTRDEFQSAVSAIQLE